MSFDLRVEPDGHFPNEYTLEDEWPNDEYHTTPFYSAKFVRDSSILDSDIIDELYGDISPKEAVELSNEIEQAVKSELPTVSPVGFSVDVFKPRCFAHAHTTILR